MHHLSSNSSLSLGVNLYNIPHINTRGAGQHSNEQFQGAVAKRKLLELIRQTNVLISTTAIQLCPHLGRKNLAESRLKCKYERCQLPLIDQKCKF